MIKDPNFLIALEKSIREKYGEEAIINPKGNWTPDKETDYIEDYKKAQIKESKNENSQERLDLNGVLITKKLINKNTERHCEYCNRYSFNRDDSTYFTKFNACYQCYLKYIIDREERWKSGWRPNGAK